MRSFRISPRTGSGFTLMELMVALAVLAILLLFITRLFDSATQVTTGRGKRIDSDAQSRPVFDRMGIDLAQMIQRPDVGYYMKSSTILQVGNDQVAFFSGVTGYYPSPSYRSPVSVVAYRINPQNQFERMGKGLHWNGASSTYTPIVFSPINIATTWPAAANSSADPNGDYELVGPQVFRFEYGYLLKTGAWASIADNFQNVAAIAVTLATIDSGDRAAVNNNLAGLITAMSDYTSTMKSSGLAAQWQSVLQTTTQVPRRVASDIRVYTRVFPISR